MKKASTVRFAIQSLLLATAPLALVACVEADPNAPASEETPSPGILIMPTIESQSASQSAGLAVTPAATSNLLYNGGSVETTCAVYLVFWGSQWSSDPSGEASLLQNFLNHVGGSQWANIDTQYTQSGGAHACSNTGQLAGVWFDNASTAPHTPTQSNLASEATKAASHFGSSSNRNAQYVIATSHGNNASGFGTQYCAWHSSTGSISYTNLPYITDAGASCGANFNGLGANAGITIVEGHEYAETVTDPFPSSGWVDSSGAENGDKCAWTSTTSNQSLNGVSFPVQPLWSNAISGCAL